MRTLARGERVLVRRPEPQDAELFVRAVRASTELHARWVYPPQTHVAFATWMEILKEPSTEAHLLVHHGDLVGVANINNIVRGSLLGGSIGYYGFAGHGGSGLVREGVGLVVKRAFAELGLHRIEANIQPLNTASIRLAEAVGFRYEGFSANYLKVGGEWRDHNRYALINHRI